MTEDSMNFSELVKMSSIYKLNAGEMFHCTWGH